MLSLTKESYPLKLIELCFKILLIKSDKTVLTVSYLEYLQ